MSMMNRLGNATNRYQGNTRKVLCVCSAGLLRSPTIAHVLSGPPWNFNTRAAGMSTEYALIPVDDVLVTWADDIIVVETGMERSLELEFPESIGETPVHVLKLDDKYEYRDPYLVKLIEEGLHKLYPIKEDVDE